MKAKQQIQEKIVNTVVLKSKIYQTVLGLNLDFKSHVNRNLILKLKERDLVFSHSSVSRPQVGMCYIVASSKQQVTDELESGKIGLIFT